MAGFDAMLRTYRSLKEEGTFMGRPRSGRQSCTIRKTTPKHSRHPAYIVDWFDARAKRHQPSFKTYREAQDHRAGLFREGLVGQKYGSVDTFASLAPTYVEHLRRRKATGALKATTLKGYERILEKRLVPEFGERAVNAITHVEVNRYIEARAQQVGNATLNRERSLLFGFFTWAHGLGHVEIHPLRGLVKQRKEKRSDPYVLSEPEQAKLFSAAKELDEHRVNPFLYLFMLVALDTGIRPGRETGCILSLRWDWVGFEEVNPDESIYGTITLPDTKGNKRLTVPLSRRLRRLLEERRALSTSDWVFPSPQGRGKGGDGHLKTWWKPFKEALAIAGLPVAKIRPYCMRHTAATNMLMRGVPIQVVQRIMGHGSIAITQRYARSTDAAEREAIRRLGEIAEGPKAKSEGFVHTFVHTDSQAEHG